VVRASSDPHGGCFELIRRQQREGQGVAGRTTLTALLRQAQYRRLWVARTVSQWGDAFNTVALVLLVYSLTGSGLGVSGVVVAEIIPVLALAPIAGAVVDRLPRVQVMIGADLVRAALAFALPFIDGHVGAVYAVAVGLSAGAVFFNPAAQSVLPAIVRERDLVAANSGLWTAAVVSQVVLAPLAGIVVASFGYTWAFWINAASYLLSAVVLRRLTLPAAPTSTARASWYADAAAGITAVAGHRLLRALAVGQFLAALSAGATGALLVVLAREHLALGVSDYGLLLGAIGVGAALGPLLLSRLTDDPRRPVYVLGPFVLRAAVDALLASMTGLVAAMTALLAYGIGTSTGAVTFNSLLQAETPEKLRGRVFAGFDMLWQCGRLLSLLAGGLLADTLGIRAVYYLGAALLLAAAAAGWSGLRHSNDAER
jgi:MFS family permease